MKNVLLIGTIILALAIGWFILNPGDTFDYVVTFEDEVTALEAELVAVEAAVNSGTLTAEAAAEARTRIITRLEAAQTAAANSERAQLTPEQRAQLTAGLERLKNILTDYLATLTVVEETAAEAESVQEERRRSGSSYRTLTLVVAETVEAVEETVEETVAEYEADAEFAAELEAIVEAEAEVVEDIASSSDEMAEEESSDTTTDETEETTDTSSEGTEESTEETPEETPSEDTSTTGEAEGETTIELEAETQTEAETELNR